VGRFLTRARVWKLSVMRRALALHFSNKAGSRIPHGLDRTAARQWRISLIGSRSLRRMESTDFSCLPAKRAPARKPGYPNPIGIVGQTPSQWGLHITGDDRRHDTIDYTYHQISQRKIGRIKGVALEFSGDHSIGSVSTIDSAVRGMEGIKPQPLARRGVRVKESTRIQGSGRANGGNPFLPRRVGLQPLGVDS
jgi:hypothetical protein